MSSSTPVSDGFIDFTHGGEIFKTYYKVFGDLTKRTRVPLVALHGGPGLVHDYLTSFSELAEKYDVPVILYDQIGNGGSTHLKEKPPTFWTIDLFIDELVNVLNHFYIQDGFSLLGHSWGGILAVEFELRRQPAGLKYLILSDSLAAYSLWIQSTVELMQQFSQEVQQGLMGGMKEPSKYFKAILEFHSVHGCTVKPLPPGYLAAFEKIFGPNGDPTVTSVGLVLINDWSSIDRLHLVRVPTFVINGRDDIAQDFVVQPFFDKIKKVKWVTFEKSSHMPFYEEPERYFKLLNEFMKSE